MDVHSLLDTEIRERLGVLPGFFRLAPEAPAIASNLWAFAKFGYLDNPLPPLFKERLFVSLSRFCEARYCISRHVGFLIGLGRLSGDAHARPQTVEQTVALLRRPLARDGALDPIVESVASHGPSAAAPEPGSPLEGALFDCAAHVFVQSPDAARCREALARYFEPATFQHLLVLLTFVRTAHYWTVVHPELEVEDDITKLLELQEELAECVRAQPDGSQSSAVASLLAERESLRRERQLRVELERTNAELLAERERLQVTLASIGDGVITTDTEGRIVDMNAVAEALTGWTRAEVVAHPIESVLDIVHETTREPVENPAMLALREGTVQTLSNHTVLIARDGTERPIDDSAAPIRDKDGRIIGCVLIFRDVTERREKHVAAERLAAIVDSSDDAIVSKTLDGVIRSWNAAAERLFGYSAEEAIGRHITMLIPPDLVGEEETIIERLRAGERIEHFDTVRLRRDGSPVEVSLTISPVRDVEGCVIGASKTARDITERRRTEAALRKAAAEVAEADQRKTRFLAILAHELRNPLSPIRSCIQFLKSASGAGNGETLAIMDRQVNQMVRLIDDLLDISRISRGKLELRRQRIELQAVIRRAIESVQPRIEQREHLITVEGASAPIALDADEARLTQVFANLLINAAKYSPPRGRITVQVSAVADRVSISVTDEGIGIPPDKLEEIFEMFVQIEGAPHEAQGLGIGLTMARELVELHGGRLSVESEGPGKGATFTVVLPRGAARAGDPGRSSAGGSTRELGGCELKILVVDDSRDSAEALAMLLRLHGCEVRAEFNGHDALAAAEAFRPNVVILDIGMPGMSGLETAEHIRRAEWGREMTLVALSGWGQASDKEKSRRAGFDEHLIKPADLDAIARILSRAAKRTLG